MSKQDCEESAWRPILLAIFLIIAVIIGGPAILFLLFALLSGDWKHAQQFSQYVFLICGIIYLIVLLWRPSKIQKINSHFVVCVVGIIIGGVNQQWQISRWYFEEHTIECIFDIVGHFFGASLAAAIGFWLSLIVLLVVKIVRARKNKSILKQELAVVAFEELNTGNVDKYIWAQALVAAKGDETVAKAEYIKLRAR